MVIPANVPLDRLHAYANFGQVFQAPFKIGLWPAQLQDHETFLPGQNAGFKDVEAQVEFLNQLVDDGFIPVFLGKMENDLLRGHGLPPAKELI